MSCPSCSSWCSSLFYFSDKWWQDPTPSLAFLETLRSFLNDAGLSYRHVLPKIMDALQLQTPHHIGNFLRKIKTQSSKAMAGKLFPVGKGMEWWLPQFDIVLHQWLKFMPIIYFSNPYLGRWYIDKMVSIHEHDDWFQWKYSANFTQSLLLTL